MGVSRDITKRKSAEEALRESEEKHRLLFQKATDPVLLLDGDTYVDCNEAALNFIGCSRHQLIGLHPWDVSPERQPDGSGCPGKKPERSLRPRLKKESAASSGFIVPLTGGSCGRRCLSQVSRSAEGGSYTPKSEGHREAQESGRGIDHQSAPPVRGHGPRQDCILGVDYATETFLFDDSFYAFYGTTAEHEGGYRMAIEEYDKRFVHPDDRAMVRQSAQKTSNGGKNRRIPCRS